MQVSIQQDDNKTTQLQSFFFQPVFSKLLQSSEQKEILQKWGLLDTLVFGTFRFNQMFQDIEANRFLMDLFSNVNIREIMKNIQIPSQKLNEVKFTKIRCTELSMEMFDKLQQHKIVNGSYIAKTYPQTYENIEVNDKLREMLLLQESQNYTIFDESNRNQLIFRLFRLLVLGGSLNQYQDKIDLYLQWTKKLYKSLVLVRKRPESQEIYVQSYAYNIQKIGQNSLISSNPQDFVYVIVCPSIRTVHILSNKWHNFW